MRQITHETDLARQARQIQERYTELFDYLDTRDRKLEAVLARIPSESDVETGGVFNVQAWLEGALRDLEPGLARLSNSR